MSPSDLKSDFAKSAYSAGQQRHAQNGPSSSEEAFSVGQHSTGSGSPNLSGRQWAIASEYVANKKAANVLQVITRPMFESCVHFVKGLRVRSQSRGGTDGMPRFMWG